MSGLTAHCRLYAILARDGRSAVVFRRGPSKTVRLLRWHLRTDVIEAGQWFLGRVHERRGDLSPDGELLVYFAAKHSGPIGTWTAVSRPPSFTALALWPKGDTWGGGGLFENGRRLGLNHRAGARLHPDFRLPPNLVVDRVGPWAGHGEDDPIEHVRLLRDGWRLVAEAPPTETTRHGRASWMFASPEVYERDQPGRPRRSAPAVVLRRELHAIFVVGGPKYDEAFILRRDGRELRRLHPCDWADWQSDGDLLFARDGCLYRLPAAAAATAPSDPLADARLVADLRPMSIEPVPASAAAQRWPKGFGAVPVPPRPRSTRG
jgi:hypothetical protein